MKRIQWIITLLAIVTLISGCAPKGTPTVTPTVDSMLVGTAEQVVDDLASGNAAVVYAQFDSVM